MDVNTRLLGAQAINLIALPNSIRNETARSHMNNEPRRRETPEERRSAFELSSNDDSDHIAPTGRKKLVPASRSDPMVGRASHIQLCMTIRYIECAR